MSKAITKIEIARRLKDKHYQSSIRGCDNIKSTWGQRIGDAYEQARKDDESKMIELVKFYFVVDKCDFAPCDKCESKCTLYLLIKSIKAHYKVKG